MRNTEVVKTINSLHSDEYKRFKAYMKIITTQRSHSPKKQRTQDPTDRDDKGSAKDT